MVGMSLRSMLYQKRLPQHLKLPQKLQMLPLIDSAMAQQSTMRGRIRRRLGKS